MKTMSFFDLLISRSKMLFAALTLLTVSTILGKLIAIYYGKHRIINLFKFFIHFYKGVRHIHPLLCVGIATSVFMALVSVEYFFKKKVTHKNV